MLADEQFNLLLLRQQPALRRLCVYMTRSEDVVDDLLQTILLEAWEHRHSVRDERALPRWLSAIARNVCRMWLRHKVLHQQRAPLLDLSEAIDELGGMTLEEEVERRELAYLLDRALGCLPIETRALLVAHLIEGRSASESALRLGISVRTVEKRLERGKSAFRHLLQTDFYSDVAPYLLSPQQGGPWETTRLYCPRCGQQCLRARFSKGLLQFDCPSCSSMEGPYITMAPAAGVRGYQRLLQAMMKTLERRYADSLAHASYPCPGCGRTTPLQRGNEELLLRCSHCHTINQNSLPFLALVLHPGRQFWLEHERICLLPRSELEVTGRPALRVAYQAVSSQATHEVFFARDTFEILSIQSTKG
ncbi:RNA polymerase sigma factor [Dictyobacter aurantiacus]|uniref:RNA polymerase sigma factor n=1 Tax=Dictyobacter aurantiacus TaxID=1936993 RepID=A0A401ZIQ1_9CHLR|nr:RNA polymerase sigma factor [Dictyobacter aurantiacus]GCE06719.1 hypothetical protein KDAU_40480 [Dictyobacter aurantiacus]